MVDEPTTHSRRAVLALVTNFGVYAGLVATHRGEFWPLSIYPMFSLAGRPWRRALMVELPPGAQVRWESTTLDSLPGAPLSTEAVGVSTNDMSKFVQLTERWDDAAVATMRELWWPVLEDGRVLLLLRADGHLDASGTVITRLTPLLRLTATDGVVNPTLKEASR